MKDLEHFGYKGKGVVIPVAVPVRENIVDRFTFKNKEPIGGINYYKALYGIASLRSGLEFAELIMDLQKSKKFTRKHFKPVNSVDFMLTIREFFHPIGNDNYIYHVPDIEAIEKANFAKLGAGQKLKSITKTWKF